MRLALASLLLLTGCASETVPASNAAPGVKRLGSARSHRPPAVTQGRKQRHPSSVASRSSSRRPVAHNWNQVAACESSRRWHLFNPPYSGGLQFTLGTWAAYGGTAFAARPDLASKAQQIAIAERVLRGQGTGAWPICGSHLLPVTEVHR